MLQFLQSEYFLSLCFSLFGLIAFIITYFRTGSIKKSVKSFKECLMKYQTIDDKVELEKSGSYSQKFSPYVDDYVLNSETNCLEKLPNPVNIQEKIQSYLSCALEQALEKFLPNFNVQEDDSVAQYVERTDDLAVIGDAIERAEEYREHYNLPDNMSISEIYSYIDKQAKQIKQHINSVHPEADKQSVQVKDSGSKEVTNVEIEKKASE